ncbi:uncharacterized protein [Euwallacea fornicatus]|uniref:uncharacterized protein n=1 Tax=Euwallacea fornicatus TaxID=995702 RepID=UPI00338E7682
MRNIEIKAKVTNLSHLLQQAKNLSQSEPTLISQHDTFYNCTTGRLKLRRLLKSGSGELIFYDRPDTEGPKLSSYEKTNLSNNDQLSSLHNVLAKALGIKSEVKKNRHLFLVGQTRVHIDEVESLGNFMELEVCLNSDQSEKDGEKIAYDLMAKLGVSEKDLISGAYADLLAA